MIREVLKNLAPEVRDVVSSIVCGMGARSTSFNLQNHIEKYGLPKIVLLAGFAGGLNPKLESGDVVVEIQAPSDKTPDLSKIYDRHCIAGSFFCQDSIASKPSEKSKLYDITRCDVVDMESEAVSKICASYGIPAVIIKAVTDPQDSELPVDFSKFMKDGGNLNMPALIFYILARPWIVPKMMDLAGATKKCKNELTYRLGALLPILAKSLP